MSHFSVMVIGNDVEKQLAPYHEFECTGHVDEYVQNVDVTDECRKNGLEWHGLDDKTVTDESLVDLEGEHKYGYAVINADGELVKAVNRTNPNKQWDWWVVGGRYSNRLKRNENTTGLNVGRDENLPEGMQVGIEVGPVLRDGELYVNQAFKRDIDFDGMRDEAGANAAATWDKAAEAKVAAGFTTDATWESWESVRDRHSGNVEAARDEYHSQSVKSAVAKAFPEWFFRSFDEFLTPRDAYIQQARDSALVQYALVKGSQWFAKGEMGWFGMSTDSMPQAEWNRKVNELLDELPDDTLITIVDCHI